MPFALVLFCVPVVAQDLTLRGKVDVVHHASQNSGSANVVVWLTPEAAPDVTLPTPKAFMAQKDKRFSPHVVAVRVGTEIEFPNRDPFFHDVFSIYHGKPFDLGLYESGTSRRVRFSHTGVSYIFCNIHPDMSAIVVAVPTPYYAISSKDGNFEITHLAPGHYKVEFWYELASPSELKSLTREVEINQSPAPIVVTMHSTDVVLPHLNKYGQEYAVEKSRSY